MMITKGSVQTKGRINALQGLRAVAFISIFISHTGIGNLGCLGAWGVSVFFVLSGFLMIYSYFPKENAPCFGFGFAWGKIKKLYPLHIVTMIFAAVYAIYIGTPLKKTLLDVLIHSLLIQMWIPNTKYYTTLNGPAWYLCASFFMYLCFPLMLKIFKKNFSKKKAVILLALLFVVEILVALLAFLLNNHDNNAWFCTQWITYYFPPVRCIDFLAGGCLGYLFLVRTESLKNSLIEIATCILIVLSLGFYIYAYKIPGLLSVKFSLLFLPTTLSLIWIVSNEQGIISRVLSVKAFVKLGDLSPYTFLIHGVAIKYCRGFFKNVLLIENNYVISIIAFAVTILAAVLWVKLNVYFYDKLKTHRSKNLFCI